jgi:hypothetical protein
MRNTLIHFVLRFYDIFLAGFYTLILIYVAGLSARQSIVLALLFTGLAHGISRSARKPGSRLRPYRVRIVPDLHQILCDFQMIRTPQEWRQLQDGFKSIPPEFGSIWGYGIAFTVASESEDRERALIYSDSHKCFMSEVRFEEDLSPLEIERIDKTPGFPDHQRVSLFVRPGGGSGGYDAGISVPMRWWETVKQSCPKPIREEKDHPTGYINLILATISYREFDLYWEQVERKYDDLVKTAKEIEARRDQCRKLLGWEIQEHPDFPELCIDWPDTIKHAYFLVEHRAI